MVPDTGRWYLTFFRNDPSGRANVVLRDCGVLPPQQDRTCGVVAQRRGPLKQEVTNVKKHVLPEYFKGTGREKNEKSTALIQWSPKVHIEIEQKPFYYMCLKFFNTCIIRESCVTKSLLAWLQLGNVCFVWPRQAGAGRIKVMNMKKDGQKCRCLRNSSLFLGNERGRGGMKGLTGQITSVLCRDQSLEVFLDDHIFQG